MRNFRFIVGKRVGPFWVGASWRPSSRQRYVPVARPKWQIILGLVVGLTFFICVMGVVFG